MAERRRPVIAVTGPDQGGLAAWWATKLAVMAAGGRPVRVTPSRPHGLEGVDGLVIGGGADVDPTLYGETEEHFSMEELRPRRRGLARFLLTLVLLPMIYIGRRLLSARRAPRKDAGRDELEAALIDAALAADLPILGICRGAQLLNVRCGGSLYQELSAFYREAPQAHTIFPYKDVAIAPESRLAAVMGVTGCEVNSMHRQAIKALGASIRAVAHEHNGVIQGVEHETARLAVGVQWHPEYLPQRPEQRALFRALIEAAAQPAARKGHAAEAHREPR